MKNRKQMCKTFWLMATVLVWPFAAMGQVPVDENGNPVGDSGAIVAEEDLTVLSAAELEELVGPIALYPDDLLAIVLPASTYPLQIVEAARFLDDLESNPSLEPDEDWDDSVVALTNYPEVVEMMNDDLDWTFSLGEAVVAQQTDVIKAIESFRDRAYAAGNLKSDDFQSVTEEDGVIHIAPAEEEVIYVPYYEPERVIVYQPRPVYYYYPRPYPLYYYPYPVDYSFGLGYFWGVTTAFTIGWHTHHLHTWHYSYYGHPYYGHTYWNNWWYRRPDIHVYNNYYVNNNYVSSYNRYSRGDYWQPNTRRTVRSTDQRITRTRYYPGTDSQARTATTATRSASTTTLARNAGSNRTLATANTEKREPITFRERTATATRSDSALQQRTSTSNRSSSASASRPSTVKPSSGRPTTLAPSASSPSTVKPSAVRPSTLRSSTERAQQTARLNSSAVTRQGTTRSSTSQSYAARSSAPVTTYSRPSSANSSYSRQSTPTQSFARQSTPKVSQSRTSTSSSKSTSSKANSSTSNRSGNVLRSKDR